MRILPFRTRVLIQPDKPEETSRGGILLPDDREKGTTATGTVLAVGEGRILDTGRIVPCDCKAGDRVLYHRAPAQAVTPLDRSRDDDPVLIDDGDVLGVFE